MSSVVAKICADALGNVIRGGEDLLALFVKQKVIVAKVRAGHVPMEVLGLQVEGEHVDQKHVECGGDVRDSTGLEVGGRVKRAYARSGGSLEAHRSKFPAEADPRHISGSKKFAAA
jgi:hypothetical protein